MQLSTPIKLEKIPPDRDYADLHSYQFNADAPRYMYLKIDKGVHGFGDFVLSNDYVAVIKIPEYPKIIGNSFHGFRGCGLCFIWCSAGCK